MTASNLSPTTTEEIVEFDTQANEDQWYNTEPTNPIPSMQNEGVRTDTQSVPTPSTIAPTTASTSSRGRQQKLSWAMQESISQCTFYGQKDMRYMANQSIETPTWEELKHDQHLELQEQMRHPITFHAEMMGNIMHMHQAICQPYAAEFIKAMSKDINAYVDKKHWVLIKRNKVPTNSDVIRALWSMRRKYNLTTNIVTKYKARLNIHGGKQVYGMNYYKT